MAWKFPGFKPNQKFVVYHQISFAKKGLYTKRNLTKAIIEVWYRNEEIAEKCKHLVESMPNRVTELLKNGGGHIKY